MAIIGAILSDIAEEFYHGTGFDEEWLLKIIWMMIYIRL